MGSNELKVNWNYNYRRETKMLRSNPRYIQNGWGHWLDKFLKWALLNIRLIDKTSTTRARLISTVCFRTTPTAETSLSSPSTRPASPSTTATWSTFRTFILQPPLVFIMNKTGECHPDCFRPFCLMLSNHRGPHSTEVGFALLTQQPRVWIPCLLKPI